jgi:hypothetical protein
MFSMVALRSWPGARKVLDPVSDAITLGETGGLAGAEAGALGTELADAGELACVAGALAGLEAGAAAVLPDELQAVTSKAAQAKPAKPATRRALRAFVVNMDFQPLKSQFLSGSVSDVTDMTAVMPPRLEEAYEGADDTARSAYVLTGRAGRGRFRDRTDRLIVIPATRERSYPKHWPSPRYVGSVPTCPSS